MGNSSAGTGAEADTILPKLAKMHLNTVLMPVAWQEIEPEEGHFDFSILDYWITVARREQIHLVLLWFGSWKNAISNYAPEWVRSDTSRFRQAHLAPELAAHFNAGGHTWKEMFGEAAHEVFMAWHYALFINKVAEAGRQEYPLPMYANAQLPAPFERAGEYPSGAPRPYYQDVYRIGAPSLDFYSPDIYWPNFEYGVERHQAAANPIFVPEARLDGGPYNALFTFGEARGFEFFPFGVESQTGESHPTLPDVCNDLSDMLDAQAKNEIRGLVLHAASPRPTCTVSLGGYLFQAALSRSWPARTILTDDGALLVMEVRPNEFYMAGSGLTVDFFRDPDSHNRLAGIARVEQISNHAGQTHVYRVMSHSHKRAI